jgi:hypothetical protein
MSMRSPTGHLSEALENHLALLKEGLVKIALARIIHERPGGRLASVA